MRYVITAEEMKHYDNATIEKIGIPSLLLMERAAMETVEVLSEYCNEKSRILILAGGGNNGGDAIAVGRLLSEKGHYVSFWLPMGIQKTSKETAREITIIQNMGFSIHDNFPEGEYDIIIDGLFGIGLTRVVEGIFAEAVQTVNRLKEKGAFIVSVDMPSGICADTGKVMGCAVKADVTVTFAYGKVGHYFYPGREYTGKLYIKSIGIDISYGQKQPSYRTTDKEDLAELLPVRKPDGNKGTFGKVLLYAGSKEICGAAVLCAEGIFTAGAGMVKILTHEANRVTLQKTLPEAMLLTYNSIPQEEGLSAAIAWADVIVAGPGIGIGPEAAMIMEKLLAQKKKPFVADADGLNLIAAEERLRTALAQYETDKLIMTPHPGELCRLLNISMTEYKNNRVSAVKTAAGTYHCVVVGKDATTLVIDSEGEMPFLNHLGNDGMAVAGSGDVLAGIIGGFLAQGQKPALAAISGVTVHALAGEKAAGRKSRYAMKASHITESMCELFKEAEEKRSLYEKA